MSNYRPSTLDDFDVMRRQRDAQRRQIIEQSAPTGSNVYGTTEKVEDLDLTGLQTRVSDLETGKQDVLTAGDNIQIVDDTISATDTTYTAGANVQISAANVISATDTTYDDATQSTHGLMSATDKVKLDNLAYLPVGSMVIMRTDTAPTLYGTWTRVTGFHLPMTSVSSTTFYLYERTA